MKRSVRAFIAVGIASVLCFGSFEVATAVTSKPSLSATQAIAACATGGGLLRLASASGKCPSGTTKIGLSRQSIAPRAMAIDITSGSQGKSLSLLASTKLVADASASGTGGGVFDSVCSLTLAHAGKTQIDGTSFLTRTSGAIADFNGNMTPAGADSVYSPVAGTFRVVAEGNSDFSTLNLHLLVTVPGAVFTIDAILDANAVTGYCRITAEVESAAT
jgi:hypothetical protein